MACEVAWFCPLCDEDHGAGAAIVGDPDQVIAKLRSYADVGMEAFILSGYPHAAEGDLFARHVLSRIDHAPLLPRTSEPHWRP
jgi:alkanesulfonate monooxygenase